MQKTQKPERRPTAVLSAFTLTSGNLLSLYPPGVRLKQDFYANIFTADFAENADGGGRVYTRRHE
jgi:hypothetical protein